MPKKKAASTELADQKDQLHTIKALGDTQGGKALVSLLVADIVGSIHKLTSGGHDPIKETAEIKCRMELAQLIVNAEESEAHIDALIAEALLE
jgi:hypothetical protein